MCEVTTIVYGLAGMAKILGPAGWQWADGQNLRNHVAYDTLAKHLMTSSEGSDWVPFLFEIDGAMMAMAWIALIVELCAPLFLVNRRLSQLWVLLAIGMHWGIRILMGLTFAYQTFGFAFLSFFAIERVLKLWPEAWPGRVATE